MKSGGIYPALVTPYTKDGNVDKSQLKALVDKLVNEGVHGFYLTGSTGECFFLSEKERMQVVETAAEAINKRAQMIVHVGAIGTNHAKELARHAANCGADAISAIPPFYYKYSFDEIKNHYFSIMDTTDLPMVVYNMPSLSGIEFNAEQFCQLAEHPNMKAIKFTSTNLFQLWQFKQQRPDVTLFNGFDEIFLAGLSMGAVGAIGSTFNVMAPRYLRLLEAFRNGNLAEAQKEQFEANEVITAMIGCGVQQSIKYLLEKQGVICNGCREPMHALTSSQMEQLDIIFPKL